MLLTNLFWRRSDRKIFKTGLKPTKEPKCFGFVFFFWKTRPTHSCCHDSPGGSPVKINHQARRWGYQRKTTRGKKQKTNRKKNSSSSGGRKSFFTRSSCAPPGLNSERPRGPPLALAGCTRVFNLGLVHCSLRSTVTLGDTQRRLIEKLKWNQLVVRACARVFLDLIDRWLFAVYVLLPLNTKSKPWTWEINK